MTEGPSENRMGPQPAVVVTWLSGLRAGQPPLKGRTASLPQDPQANRQTGAAWQGHGERSLAGVREFGHSQVCFRP